MRRLALLALLALAACSKAPTGAAPHQIHIAGSSAGYPLSTQVAERLMREAPDVLAPLVRAGGTGEGIARFCDTDNPTRPDILITTRFITPKEMERCHANGSTDYQIVQSALGESAIVLIQGKRAAPLPGLRINDVEKALTSSAKTWADVRKGLPPRPIILRGPTPTPAIADTLYGPILRDDQRVRTDGAYKGYGADADMVIHAVAEAPGAIGVVPLSQALAHRDTVTIIPFTLVPGLTNPKWHLSDHDIWFRTYLPLMLIHRRQDTDRVPGLALLLKYYQEAIEAGRPDIESPPPVL
jgi:ABC-type phosphate transport system substrate-binding protein